MIKIDSQQNEILKYYGYVVTFFLIARWTVKILYTRHVLLNNAPKDMENATGNKYKRTW